MGEMVPEWAQMWGAKVKMPTDMRDDMLRDAIETSRDALDHCGDFEAEGVYIPEVCAWHVDTLVLNTWRCSLAMRYKVQ